MANLVLKAEQAVALDSPDHLMPHGTRLDNSRNPLFNKKLGHLLGHKPLWVLDLGCSGGGFVKNCLDEGHIAVGLEGSDYSKKQQRAEWATIPDHLFTCDVSRPFELSSVVEPAHETTPVQFDVITAWELIEHIKEQNLPQVCQNVLRHLRPGGLWIMSVSPNPEVIEGRVLHQTVQGADWWLNFFRQQGLENHPELVQYFDCDWVRGPLQNAPGSFHLILSRQGETPPDPPSDAGCSPEELLAAGKEYLTQEAFLSYAIHLFRRALPLLPPGKMVETGRLLSEHNALLEVALEFFDRATPSEDANPQLAELRASCLLRMGQFLEAETAVQAALKGRPHDDSLRRIQTELDLIACDVAHAGKYGTQGFWRHLNLGIFLRHRDRLAESQTELEKALVLRPNDESALFQLRETLKTAVRRAFDAKQYDQALALLEAFPARQKDGEWNYLRAQALHWQRQEPAAARRHYDLALRLGHDEFWVRALRGRLALETGDLRAARADLARALELHPDDADAKNDLAAAQRGLAALPAPKSAALPAAPAKRPEPSLLRRPRKRALIFWPYCALPPHTGTHGTCLSDFAVLRDLGFEVALYGTTLCTDNSWEPLGREDVQKMLGARVYYHVGTPADQEYIRPQPDLGPGRWAAY